MEERDVSPITRSPCDPHQDSASFHHHDDEDAEAEDAEEQVAKEGLLPNNHNHHHTHHPYHSLYNHEQYHGEGISKPLVVMEVADQLKEKLAIKNSAHHPINGCVLTSRENGLTKLDRLDESLQPAVHCNNNNHHRQMSTGVSKALPDNEDTVVTDAATDDDSSGDRVRDTCLAVNCEKSDSTKDDDAYPRVHVGPRRDANALQGPSLTAVQNCSTVPSSLDSGIAYVGYESEVQMPDIMRLIQKDLSEPYSIYTYRYFIHNWPKLCFLAMDEEKCVGAVVCKLDLHKNVLSRGYIAMLAVDEKYRKRKIGSNLVLKAIRAMVADHADEVVLETEITNKPALRLYENLGFVRDKRLFRYYLNGVDALRLKLWLR